VSSGDKACHGYGGYVLLGDILSEPWKHSRGRCPKAAEGDAIRLDSNTGESELKVLVPKGLNRGLCDVTVLNKVGSHTFTDGFTVD